MIGGAMDLELHILHKLCELAQLFDVEKLVLFGSRARGNNHKRSDIDLAVWGIKGAGVYLDFQEAVEEQVMTLLRFDIVDMGGISVSDDLRSEIAKDGVVLYEKV